MTTAQINETGINIQVDVAEIHEMTVARRRLLLSWMMKAAKETKNRIDYMTEEEIKEVATEPWEKE